MSLLINESHANPTTACWTPSDVSMTLSELATTYSTPIASGANTIVYTIPNSLCPEVGAVYEITFSVALTPTWSVAPVGNFLMTLGHYNSSIVSYNRAQTALSSITATTYYNGNMRLVFQRRADTDVIAFAILHNTLSTLNSVVINVRDFAVRKIGSSVNAISSL